MKIANLIAKTKYQLSSFLGKLQICKPSKRFVTEAVYGITANQTVHLTKIARALQEPIRLIKTVNRLSRGLNREGLWESITRFVVCQAKDRIEDLTLLVLDLSDIAKFDAKKMEFLAEVRDGSRHKIGLGYWLLQIVAVSCGQMDLIPLLNHLWSQNAIGHLSENEEILYCMDLVSNILGRKGIWVIDRGGDRKNLYYPFLDRGWRFLIRMVGNRNLLYKGSTALALDLAKSCPLLFRKTIDHTNKHGKTERLHLEYGFRKVRLPDRPEDLYMIVVTGFGAEPMMLLTNVSGSGLAGDWWWLVRAYITRWRVEDLLRFVKQSYKLEDIRLLGYRRLQNMMALLMLAAYFNMVILAQDLRMRVCRAGILNLAKRVFGVGEFFFYGIADGLAELFSKNRVQPFPKKKKPPKNPIQTALLLRLAT